MKTAAIGLLCMAAFTCNAGGTTETEAEVEQLISLVGDSQCDFIRNGKAHTADAAASHLRMKFKRGKKYVASTEEFIERIASKSSITRRPYEMDCIGQAKVAAKTWLTTQLAIIREKVSKQIDDDSIVQNPAKKQTERK